MITAQEARELSDKLDTDPKPDHAIVFPGGAGTMDMYRRIKASGISYTLAE